MISGSDYTILLIGITHYDRDDLLPADPLIDEKFREFQDTLDGTAHLQIERTHIGSLLDPSGNTIVKESLAEAASAASSAFVYFSGAAVFHRGRLFLGNRQSSRDRIIANGLPVEDLREVLTDLQLEKSFIVLDAPVISTDGKEILSSETLQGILDELTVNQDIYMVLGKKSGNGLINDLGEVLSEGLPFEQKKTTFDQVVRSLQDKSGVLIHGSKNIKERQPEFVPNVRFLNFTQLINEGDAQLDKEKLDLAKEAFEKAAELFPSIQEPKEKAAFVNHLIEGESDYQEEDFEKSLAAYEEAAKILEHPLSSRGIEQSLERLASLFYEKEKWEDARSLFERLVRLNPSRDFYKNKLKTTNQEIRFENLLNEADRYFFQDQFKEALDLYKEALTINRDNIVLRRKEECEKYISKEASIREKIVGELKADIKKEYIQELKSSGELEYEPADVDRDAIKEEVKDELVSEMERKLWNMIRVWNNQEGYRFYLGMYPEGTYAQQALAYLEGDNMNEGSAVDASIMSEISSVANRIRLSDVTESKSSEEDDIIKALQSDSDVEEEAAEPTAEQIIEELAQAAEEELEPQEEQFTEEPLPKTQDLSGAAEIAQSIQDQEHSEEDAAADLPSPVTDYFSDVDLEKAEEESKEHIEHAKEEKEAPKEEKTIHDAFTQFIQVSGGGRGVKKDRPKLADIQLRQNEISEERVDIPLKKVEQAAPSSEEETDAATEIEMPEAAVEEVVHETTTTENEVTSDSEPEGTHDFDVEEPIQEPTVENIQPTVELSQEDVEVDLESLSEEELWEYATAIDSKESYLAYANNTRQSVHIAEAYQRINQLNEEEQNQTSSEGSEGFEISATAVEQEVEHKEAEEVASLEQVAEELEVNTESKVSAESSEPVSEAIPEEELAGDSEEDLKFPEIDDTADVDITQGLADLKKPGVSLPDFSQGSATIDEERLWSEASSAGTLSAYFNYLNKTKEKKYWSEAKDAVAAIKGNNKAKEQQEWVAAQQADSVEAYKNYIRNYPLGSFYAKAMFRINSLENK